MRSRGSAYCRFLAAAGILVVVVHGAMAQPPARGEGGGRSGSSGGPAKVDPAVEAWIKVLAEKMTDRHDAIRESARQGLVSIGPPALPTLRKLAEGDDGATADAARKVMARIDGGGPGGFSGGVATFGRGGQGGAEAGFGRAGGITGGGFGFGVSGLESLGRGLQGIELNEKQKAQVEEVRNTHQAKTRETLDKLREGKADFEKVRETRQKMHEDLMKDMKAILTEEQYKKFEKAMEQSGPGGRGGFPGGPGEGGLRGGIKPGDRNPGGRGPDGKPEGNKPGTPDRRQR